MNVLFIIFFIPFFSFGADLPPSLCNKEIKQLAIKWGGTNNWIKQTNDLFLCPTSKFGNWITYKIESPNNITLSKVSQKSSLRINFDKNCKRKMNVITTDSNVNLLGDNSLEQMMKNKKGIIYIWSSQMPLSIQGIKSIEKSANKKGLDLVVINASNLETPLSSKLPLKYKQKYNSLELKMRNVYLHFPTLLAFKNGQILEKIKYGYEENYDDDIKNLFTN